MHPTNPYEQQRFLEQNLESMFDMLRTPCDITPKEKTGASEDDVFDYHYQDFKFLCDWIHEDLENQLNVDYKNLRSAEWCLMVLDKFRRRVIAEL